MHPYMNPMAKAFSCLQSVCGGRLFLSFHLLCPSRHEAIHSHTQSASGQHTHMHTHIHIDSQIHARHIAHGYIFGPRKLFLLFKLFVWVDFIQRPWRNITHTHIHTHAFRWTCVHIFRPDCMDCCSCGLGIITHKHTQAHMHTHIHSVAASFLLKLQPW